MSIKNVVKELDEIIIVDESSRKPSNVALTSKDPGFVEALIQKFESGPAIPEEQGIKPAVAEAQAVIKTSTCGGPVIDNKEDDKVVDDKSKLKSLFVEISILESDSEDDEAKSAVAAVINVSSESDSDSENKSEAFDEFNVDDEPLDDDLCEDVFYKVPKTARRHF